MPSIIWDLHRDKMAPVQVTERPYPSEVGQYAEGWYVRLWKEYRWRFEFQFKGDAEKEIVTYRKKGTLPLGGLPHWDRVVSGRSLPGDPSWQHVQRDDEEWLLTAWQKEGHWEPLQTLDANIEPFGGNSVYLWATFGKLGEPDWRARLSINPD
jgi:hypothetical protein